MHFHEVGAVDAIGEVVGVALALESLGVDRVDLLAAAGRAAGSSTAAHGRLPLPAPATLELLRGRADLRRRHRRWSSSRRPARRSSPRSPRASAPLPRMTLDGSGYGAGTRDLKALPNVVRVILGTEATTGDRRR